MSQLPKSLQMGYFGGKIFVQGTKLKDLLGQHPAVVDSSEDSFIEIDPRIIFPLIKYGDKIIDIVAGKE